MSRPAEVEALHVLTLTPFFPSDQNEVSGCFIAEPLQKLKRFGVDSSVIAVSPIHYPRRRPSPSAAAEWVRYPQIPGNLGLSSAGKLLYARLIGRVRKLHSVKPVDVIHAHGALPCGHAAALLSRRLGIPFVISVHGLDVFNTCFQGGAPANWRRQESIGVYRAAQMVICISEKVQQILRDGMGGSVSSGVVYNGTDPELFSPGPVATALLEQGPPEKEILIVGNLIASKGHELVLRATAQLGTLFLHLRCQIIGEGPERARLEALASELELAQRVQFLGRQGRVAVAGAMRGCSVFVLPSSNEGLGCVYLEAMACGKPVIACRGQGIDEIIEHGRNGWLIPTDSLDDLVQGLSTLLQSGDVSSRIGTAARDTVVNGLTLSHQAQRLARIYREATARSIPAPAS
jgi:glycosyltransferase involved in cell wall biosynthesis